SNDGGDEPDDRCETTPDPGKPCEIDGELKAGWNPTTKVLKVDPSDLPESWVGKTFDGPTDDRDRVRIPVQDSRDSTGDDTTRSAARSEERRVGKAWRAGWMSR